MGAKVIGIRKKIEEGESGELSMDTAAFDAKLATDRPRPLQAGGFWLVCRRWLGQLDDVTRRRWTTGGPGRRPGECEDAGQVDRCSANRTA